MASTVNPINVLLIHPPVAKPCEPPAGIARLAGALRLQGVKCSLWDANIDGLLDLIEGPRPSTDRWTTRAYHNRNRHLASLRSPATYHHPDRYRRAVADINRLLETAPSSRSVKVRLADYQDSTLSPVRSSDLVHATQKPEENPFYLYFKRRVTERIEKEEPTHVGFSLNFLSQALCTFSMIGLIRAQWPDLVLMLGGGLVTSWVRRPGWQNPFGDLVDHLVAGPGEEFLLSLLGEDRSTSPVRGQSGPDYTHFSFPDYLAPGPILPYSASSGCYWNRCAFCPERAEGNPYVPIPADRVMEEIKGLVKETRPVLLHLLDNAVSPGLLKTFIERPPGVPWYGFTRITSHLADEDFCLDLRRSGCELLKLGLESGDQDVLDREGKGINLETASLALRQLKKTGISTYIYLLFGTPSETLTEARRTLDFIVRHQDAIGFLNLALFNLPVHGPETDQLETRTMYEGDLSLYMGFRHPRGWDRPLVRQFLDKEFKRHPAIQKILRRNPPLFTSNHAPFFCR